MEDLSKKQFKSMRRTIGALVIGMPIMSVLFAILGTMLGLNAADWYWSISHTYWTNSKIIMVSFIAICSYFFITYPGYDWRDKLVNKISGIALSMILIFPCNSIEYNQSEVLFCLPGEISQKIHVASALTLFLFLFINVFFLFTLGAKEKTEKKKQRNILYRICGLCIIPTAMLIIMLKNFNIGLQNSVWIAEAVAMIPCGIAWLVKGEALTYLNDK